MAETAGTTRAARTSAVLDPAFLEGLEGLSTDEVRRRRDQAYAEREFQSYLRRLVQVRQDILSAERDRRREGGAPQSAVERVTAALSEGRPKAKESRGEALRTGLMPDDVEEAERRADAVLDQTAGNSPEDLSDEELERSLAALAEGERTISSDRLSVMRVHDRLQEELKRRYREDPSQIPPAV
jgi:anti-sigma-K factor RsiG